jgi:hypothetical protein
LSHRCSSTGYDEPGILSYAISSFCPTSTDGLQSRSWRPSTNCIRPRLQLGSERRSRSWPRRSQGQHDDLARVSRTRSGQSGHRRSPAARDWSGPSLRCPGRVVASVPDSCPSKPLAGVRFTQRTDRHALQRQAGCQNHIDDGPKPPPSGLSSLQRP